MSGALTCGNPPVVCCACSINITVHTIVVLSDNYRLPLNRRYSYDVLADEKSPATTAVRYLILLIELCIVQLRR